MRTFGEFVNDTLRTKRAILVGSLHMVRALGYLALLIVPFGQYVFRNDAATKLPFVYTPGAVQAIRHPTTREYSFYSLTHAGAVNASGSDPCPGLLALYPASMGAVCDTNPAWNDMYYPVYDTDVLVDPASGQITSFRFYNTVVLSSVSVLMVSCGVLLFKALVAFLHVLATAWPASRGGQPVDDPDNPGRSLGFYELVLLHYRFSPLLWAERMVTGGMATVVLCAVLGVNELAAVVQLVVWGVASQALMVCLEVVAAHATSPRPQVDAKRILPALDRVPTYPNSTDPVKQNVYVYLPATYANLLAFNIGVMELFRTLFFLLVAYNWFQSPDFSAWEPHWNPGPRYILVGAHWAYFVFSGAGTALVTLLLARFVGTADQDAAGLRYPLHREHTNYMVVADLYHSLIDLCVTLTLLISVYVHVTNVAVTP